MNKAQFLYRYGIPATVTKLDGTQYSTYIQYIQKSRTSQFSEHLTFSQNYMRKGVFPPYDDVANGYRVDVPLFGDTVFVVAGSPDVKFGETQSYTTTLLKTNFTVTLQRLSKTYDSYLHPTGETWSSIGSYTANVDYLSGQLKFDKDLLMPNETLTATLQNTVPVQKYDRLVVDGTNYQVNAIDTETSPGLYFCALELDKRS